MRELSFNIEAARRYGVDGAILLQGMAAWISKNRANERHFHDGRWWTYNSQDALVKLFPFWSRRQIQRIVKALNTEGALLLGNYSDGSFHNTTWYALSDDVLELLGAGECASLSVGMPGIGPEERIATGGGGALAMTEGGEGPAAAGLTSPALRATSPEGEAGAGESTAPNGAVLESTAPNGAEYRTERGGTQDNLPKESKAKQVNTNNPPIAPQGVALAAAEFEELLEGWYGGRHVPEDDRREALRLYTDLRHRATRVEVEAQLGAWRGALGSGCLPLRELFRNDTWREDPYFWLFWQMYPRKIDKDRARRAWKKLSPARAMANAILEGLRNWKKCDQWQEERFIPHPTTWLNGRRWEAPPPASRTAAPETPEREVEEWT
ncbi:MAG: hypothetical protein IJI97_09805 [Clostridia bacterium]|nr:hypothetical protein [Clostridia bacterium]